MLPFSKMLSIRKRARSPDPEAEPNNEPPNKIVRTRSPSPTTSNSTHPQVVEPPIQEDSNGVEDGEIPSEVQSSPKTKKKKHGPRGGKQWAAKHKKQAKVRAAQKLAREAADAGIPYEQIAGSSNNGLASKTTQPDTMNTEEPQATSRSISQEPDGTNATKDETSALREEIRGLKSEVQSMKADMNEIKTMMSGLKGRFVQWY